MNATTFYDVVRDWENGLEPYKPQSPLVRATTIIRRFFCNDSCSARPTRAVARISGFFSLKLSHRFIRNCLAVVAFYLTFVCLPPLNTGDENPNGYYVHNFITNTVEYRINGKGVLLYK